MKYDIFLASEIEFTKFQMVLTKAFWKYFRGLILYMSDVGDMRFYSMAIYGIEDIVRVGSSEIYTVEY